MSLGIAILTEEGTVLATESMGTLLTTRHQEIESKCTECGYDGKPNISCVKCNKVFGPVPTFSLQSPVSHTFYCQKLFQINDQVGVITIGHTKINGLRIQHLIYQFINWLQQNNNFNEYCKNMVQYWQEYCSDQNLLENHNGKTELIFAGTGTTEMINQYAIVVVHENGELKLKSPIEFGVAMAGAHDVIDKMFGDDGVKQYPVKEFPLQDAVEFAKFLIQTQIGVDKYICRIPRVGGELDIAVIHPTYGFKWVQQKKLQQILES